MSTELVAETAATALSLGISILPPAEDGTKRPLPLTGSWKTYRSTRATEAERKSWYGRRTGLGFVCGKISGGLELFEFDDRRVYQRFRETAVAIGHGALVERIEAGYLEETPGNGVHWFYFCDEIRGNTKLAERPGPPDVN